MNIKKAVSVKSLNNGWALAIFNTDWEDKPCEPTVWFLQRHTKVLGKTGQVAPWWQMCGGWNLADLVKNNYSGLDDNQPAIYIDFGQNWFVPAGVFNEGQVWMKAYQNEGFQAHDALDGKVW